MNLKRGIILLVNCPLTRLFLFVMGGGAIVTWFFLGGQKAEAFAIFQSASLLLILLVTLFVYSLGEGIKK